MRIWLLVPVAAVFGCAHQSSSSMQASTPPPASQPEVARAEPAPAPPTKTKEAEPSAPQATAGCNLVRVHFAFDSSELTDEDQRNLDSAARCLQDNERLRVEIQGMADERGTDEYNYALGERRASAVASYLEMQGVQGERVKTISFGEERPRCTGHEESCWKHNRVAAIAPACRL